MKTQHPFMAGVNCWKTLSQSLPHEVLYLKRGTNYSPADHPDSVAVLISGMLKVFLSDEMGEERFMWIVEPYSIVQWHDNHNFSHILVAIKDSKLLLTDKTAFLSNVAKDPSLFAKYIDSIYQRYSYCVEKLIVTDIHTSQFKVYSFLLHLANRYGEKQRDGSILIENIITRNDISSITGVHRTNIIKYLSHLEKLGIIDKDRRYICIKNMSALEILVDNLDIS